MTRSAHALGESHIFPMDQISAQFNGESEPFTLHLDLQRLGYGAVGYLKAGTYLIGAPWHNA